MTMKVMQLWREYGLKALACLLAAGGLLGLGEVVFSQLAAQPERLTELYFTNYRQLPASLKSGAQQTLAFTVHNLEHQTTAYRYSIVAESADKATSQQLGEGSLVLAAGQSQVTRQSIVLPASSPRALVTVHLDYEGLAFGARVASRQSQSIHYWIRLTQAPTTAGSRYAIA